VKKRQSIYSWRNFVTNLTDNRPEHKIRRVMLFIVISGTACFVLGSVMWRWNGWFSISMGTANFLLAILVQIKWKYEIRTLRESINKTSLSS